MKHAFIFSLFITSLVGITQASASEENVIRIHPGDSVILESQNQTRVRCDENPKSGVKLGLPICYYSYKKNESRYKIYVGEVFVQVASDKEKLDSIINELHENRVCGGSRNLNLITPN